MDILEQAANVMPTRLIGSVVRTVGMTISVAGFPAPVGAVARIERQSGPSLLAEVIGFHDELTLLYPYSDAGGVRRGNAVHLTKTSKWLRVGDQLLGRVLNALGEPIDGRPLGTLPGRAPFDREPPHACTRPRIDRTLSTGVRAIDGLMTCGRGQRLGVFAGSGVGKSTTLGMMARYTDADIIVIGLIGERGREVNEFIERDLGPEGLAKSVVVVATSNEPALMRTHAATTATAIAEYFRDQGHDVLLMMDSLTRYALAQREIGLAAGEPPTTRGYPPSVFALLPRVVERAGRSPSGSITAFYTVLVEGDDPNEPVADCVRGILDGHVWLDRKLAHHGHYPAIDILHSISRLMTEICDDQHVEAAQLVRELLAVYRENEDLISIGAYRQGTNPRTDLAIQMKEAIDKFLKQRTNEQANVDLCKQELLELKQMAERFAKMRANQQQQQAAQQQQQQQPARAR